MLATHAEAARVLAPSGIADVDTWTLNRVAVALIVEHGYETARAGACRMQELVRDDIDLWIRWSDLVDLLDSIAEGCKR